MDISSSMLSTALERRSLRGRSSHRRRKDWNQGRERDDDGDEVEMEMEDTDIDEEEEEEEDEDEDGGVEGDLLLSDMGQGLPFRPGTFDGAISISAIQWLCNVDASDETSPQRRLARFFDGLYACLRRGARAVCQFYPRNDAQRSMICQAAVKAGFGAGLLEDDPGTKNIKLYLVLTVGRGICTKL